MSIEKDTFLVDFLPHRPPMLLLGGLKCFSAGKASAWAVIEADNPFLRPDGLLEGSCLVELMAQCCAAGMGALLREQGKKPSLFGYLAALRDMRMFDDARQGDLLDVETCLVARLGDVAVVEGAVRRRGQMLAAGQMKVFIPEGDA